MLELAIIATLAYTTWFTHRLHQENKRLNAILNHPTTHTPNQQRNQQQ